MFGPWLYLAWLVVGLIAWSRVRLREHSVAQTVVGAVLGAAAAGVVFPLVRGPLTAAQWTAEPLGR
ncbi:phosphatase PAP2 family protein [Micromonospora sp. NPDC049679]|uniref:phosphatase PAP2 family protein n=1 Tax=Micromonospora sp. NPDC049679 TaxID=3155920 RepID=UPI0033E2D753